MGVKIEKGNLVKEEILWSDRKRFLGLPISFTRYELTKTRLINKVGLFSTTTNEILLYRILDIEIKRRFLQKIFGVGSIILFSADPSTPNFTIKSVKKIDDVKNYLSTLIEQERESKKVTGREMFGAADGIVGGPF